MQIKQINFDQNGELWVVTTDGRLFHRQVVSGEGKDTAWVEIKIPVGGE